MKVSTLKVQQSSLRRTLRKVLRSHRKILRLASTAAFRAHKTLHLPCCQLSMHGATNCTEVCLHECLQCGARLLTAHSD